MCCKMSVLQTVVMQVENEVEDCLAIEQEVDGLHASSHVFVCVCVCVCVCLLTVCYKGRYDAESVTWSVCVSTR